MPPFSLIPFVRYSKDEKKKVNGKKQFIAFQNIFLIMQFL